MNAKDTIIRIEDLSYSYHMTPALSHVFLEVYRGDYLGIIGPNGGGKTTLLKLMLGLLRPTSGKVELFGRPVRSFHEWSRIGYVPQKATSIESRFPFTVEEVVSFGLVSRKGMFRRLGSSDSEAVSAALEQVGIGHLRKTLVTHLSGGQQQRVFIAKGLVSRPDMLILDEPTVGVDIKSQDEFYDLLSRLNRDGITLIVVSHDIDVIANEVSTLACLNRTMICHGPPNELTRGEYLDKLYGQGHKFIGHRH